MEYQIVDDTPLEVMMYDDEKVALKAIVDKLTPDAVLVEYGSGGSTIFFADNLSPVRHLISIEHNLEWYTKVQRALGKHHEGHAVDYRYIPPAFPLQRYVFANPEEEMPAGLTSYLHPDIQWNEVDFVLVDGIARGAVLATLRTKLRPGTTVVLHDYTGREAWYDWAVQLYERVNLTNMLLELKVPIEVRRAR